MIKSALTILLQLVLIVFLAFLAREAWIAYEQEKLNLLFEKESELVSVRIEKVSYAKKVWKDYIGNSKYLGFTYKGKLYGIRYLQKGTWVGEGSNIQLQYHPRLDIFRQPGIIYHKTLNKKLSKLIHWTIVGTFSYANRWLFAFLALLAIISLLLFSALTNITNLALFKILSDWFVIACFLGGAIFLTCDSWLNYRYYRQLKTNGRSIQLVLIDKSRGSYDLENKDNFFPLYYYTATVNYKEEREIMISNDDYDKLSVRDQFPVLYDASIDDMMSADYSPGYWRIFFIVFLWIIVVYTLRRKNR